jgi:hypothetical protein
MMIKTKTNFIIFYNAKTLRKQKLFQTILLMLELQTSKKIPV